MAIVTFQGTVDVVEVVAESWGLRNCATLRQMRGVSRAWAAAVNNVVRRLGKDEDESWAGATRLCPLAAHSCAVARLCIVAGGAEWLRELPPRALTAKPGQAVLIDTLVATIQRLPLLTALELTNVGPEDTQQVLAVMPAACSRLQRLVLGQRVSFSFDDNAASLAAALPQTVTAIDLPFPSATSIDAFIEPMLAAHGMRLKELRITSRYPLIGRGIDETTPDLIARLCPNLERLELCAYCSIDLLGIVARFPLLLDFKFTRYGGGFFLADPDGRPLMKADSFARAVAAHLPKIERLVVNDREHALTESGLFAIARGCPRLRELSAQFHDVPGYAIVAAVAECPSLRSLTIDHASAPDGLAGLLRVAPTLHEFHTVGVMPFPAMFEGMADLRVLNTTLSHDIAAIVAARCPSLRKLDVAVDDTVSDATLELIAKRCRGLREVVVHAPGRDRPPPVTDAGVIAIAEHCPRLESIVVSNRFNITDAAIRAISRHCPNIREIGCRTKLSCGLVSDDLVASVVGTS